jgi:hypothetical protein
MLAGVDEGWRLQVGGKNQGNASNLGANIRPVIEVRYLAAISVLICNVSSWPLQCTSEVRSFTSKPMNRQGWTTTGAFGLSAQRVYPFRYMVAWQFTSWSHLVRFSQQTRVKLYAQNGPPLTEVLWLAMYTSTMNFKLDLDRMTE